MRLFLDADEAVAAAVAGFRSGPVVGDLELEAVFCIADGDQRGRRAGVLERVRQSFLHDPVCGEVDAGRQLRRIPLDGQFDRESGVAHLLHEVIDADQGRLWRQGQLLLAFAEQTEESPHLAEGLVSRPLDGVERAASLHRLGVEQPPSTAGLNDDHADRMRHDVVELARNALALFCDGSSCTLLLLSLEGVGALLEGDLALPSVVNHPPDGPGHAEEKPEEDCPADVERFGVVHRDNTRHDRCHRAREPHAPRLGVRCRRVDGDQYEEPEELAVAAFPDQGLGKRACEHQGEEQECDPAPEDQQHAEPHCDRRVQGDLCAREIVVEDGLQEPEEDDHGGEKHVAVPAEPATKEIHRERR